jgi:uncharacterized protein YjiK
LSRLFPKSKRLRVARYPGMIVPALYLFFPLLLNCSEGEAASKSKLVKISDKTISIAEPSGLALGRDAATLWTVSDRTNRIYQLDLEGAVLKTLDFTGDDLEGIAYDAKHDALWVAEEQKRQILKISTDGTLLQTIDIDIQGAENNGLEGVAIDTLGRIWLVNEKKPQLLLRLSADFSTDVVYYPETTKDYSDICTDRTPGRIWVLSDESRMLFLWQEGKGVVETYALDVSKPEGLAIDFNTAAVYIVSDDDQKLCKFVFSER